MSFYAVRHKPSDNLLYKHVYAEYVNSDVELSYNYYADADKIPILFENVNQAEKIIEDVSKHNYKPENLEVVAVAIIFIKK